MPPTIRTARKLMLGREIAYMMQAAQVSQTQVAAMLETSQSRVAVLLNGGGSIAPGDLRLLAARLGFNDPRHVKALNEMRRGNHERGFWSTGYRRAYQEGLRLRIDLERHADQIRSAYNEVVPGLLQCESYVRAMHDDPAVVIDGLTVDELVDARMARQEIFEQANPPFVHHVLSESCVRRRWAPTDVMCEQMQHLIKLSNRPNIRIQILPFDVPPGRRSPIGTRFALLRVPSPGVAGPMELVFLESEGETRYVDDKKTLLAYNTAWTRLTTAALSGTETQMFLRRMRDDFRQLVEAP